MKQLKDERVCDIGEGVVKGIMRAILKQMENEQVLRIRAFELEQERGNDFLTEKHYALLNNKMQSIYNLTWLLGDGNYDEDYPNFKMIHSKMEAFIID